MADLVLTLSLQDFEAMSESLWQQVSGVVTSAGGTLASLGELILLLVWGGEEKTCPFR